MAIRLGFKNEFIKISLGVKGRESQKCGLLLNFYGVWVNFDYFVMLFSAECAIFSYENIMEVSKLCRIYGSGFAYLSLALEFYLIKYALGSAKLLMNQFSCPPS